jgi:2-polyprenyl-3-methyl-5-hydroxy-6-metoxy-1,4-benzoquinol methylase
MSATIRAYLPYASELEQTCCPACGQCNDRTLLKFDAFGFPIRTVECLNCGLLYANPRPTERYLRDFYETKYLYFYEGARRVDDAYVVRRRHRELAQRRIARYSRYLPPGVRVLDIGCGTGFFLAEIRKRSPESIVLGVEPDPVTADYAEHTLQLPVHRGFLESLSVSSRFDVVASFHVIEHVYDVHAFMEHARSHLQPGGYLIIETPNCAGSWSGLGMFHIAHLQTFSPGTLANVFHQHGFQAIEAGGLENEVDVSNLYVVGQFTQSSSVKALSGRRDIAESEKLENKCKALKSFRPVLLLRTWAKWLYFALGGVKRP